MTKVVKNLTIINVIVFIFGYFVQKDIPWLETFVLFPIGSENYAVHQWISHQFLHAGVAHLVFNMIALLSFGPIVEKYFNKDFIWFYLISGLGAALLQLSFVPETALLGASGAIFGILLVSVILDPESKILLFFILPIKGKWLISAILIFETYMGFFAEPDGIGHLAHLGGAITGFLYFIITRKKK